MRIQQGDETALRQWLAQGESERLEFKLRLPRRDILAQIVASFANSEGGSLAIGVSDSGDPVGLSEDEALEAMEAIDEIGRNILELRPETRVVECAGRNILIVEVPKRAPAIGPVMTPDGRIYRRDGTSTRPITSAEVLHRLWSRRPDLADPGQPLMAVQVPTPMRKARLTGFVAMSFGCGSDPTTRILNDFNSLMCA